VNSVTLTIGSIQATVKSAALAIGEAGIYIVTAIVPERVPSGTAQVVLTVAGQDSSAVMMVMK
jgi:uncharacterized protein (TIGR03437 family)